MEDEISLKSFFNGPTRDIYYGYYPLGEEKQGRILREQRGKRKKERKRKEKEKRKKREKGKK